LKQVDTLTDQTQQTKLLSPTRSGSLFYLFFFLSTGSFGPFLHVYYSELGLTGQQVGFLATFFPLMTLLFATPLSSLADRKRLRTRLVQTSTLIVAVIFFFVQFPSTFWGIALLMLPMAFFFSPVMSIADSLIARMAQRHSLNYGSMRMWGSIGFATAAFVFGAVWGRVGFKPMFVVGSLILLPVIWIASQLEEGNSRPPKIRPPVSKLFRDTGLLLLLVGTFLAGIANSLSMTFEGIYVRSLGGTSFLIGLMTAFAATAELPTMYFGGRIGLKMRGVNAVILAYGLSCSAYLGFVLLPNPTIMPVFSVLKGLGFGLFFTNTVRLITQRAPEEWASTAQSLMTVGMFGLAPLIAGPLGGAIHDHIGPSAIFGLGALALMLAAIVLMFGTARGIFKE
jgi:PPP family 3-phenylpropionic acid transporter